MKEELITIPLRDLLSIAIGDSSVEYTNIPMTVALVLEQHLKGSTIWKIVYEDNDGNQLSYPQLWRYNCWYNSTERWLRNKQRSERERVERFILDKNVTDITKALMRHQGLTESFAKPLAYKLAKAGNNEIVKILGMNSNLITKEEEL